MAFQPVQNTLTTLRTVEIPPGLTDEKRAAFVERVERAVAKQAALAEDCDAILRPVGDVREHEGLLLIEHEPATPFDLEAILTADDRPAVDTLWWVTWSALRALAASEAKRTIHGGIQLRSFFIDRIGRVKLADFGLATAVEVVCGRDSRRHIVCDAASDEAVAERGLSGSWARLDESSQRENSWIAPGFAPEILAGGMGLNLTSDQFSLGVALYELATGVHPLGAELSDPELFGYFVPEPYPFEDERSDWAEAFERQSHSTAMSGDQPVLAWAALAYRLLANEPGERFANFTEALEAAREHAPAEWTETLGVLGESSALLEHEQYDPLLTSLGPWSENAALPELWRTRLAEYISAVEQLKATESARKAVRARLDEGYAALEREQLDQARTIAAEVGQTLDEQDELHERVVELERLCDEHQRHIEEKADQLTQVNLETARQTLERGEFPEARMIVTGVLEDPLTSEAFAQQGQELLAEIDERATRFERQRDELEAAKSEFGEGKLTAALERLDRLLADVLLADSLRPSVETFAKEVETERKRHEENLATIAEVEAALARLDLATAEETLAMLPFDTADSQIIERRDTLTQECEQLRELLQRSEAIEEQLGRGEAQDALDAVSKLLEQELPPALGQRLTELAERCRQVVEQIQQAKVSDALESLTLAETAYQTGDLEQCRHLLSMVLPLTKRLDDRDQTRTQELDAAATRCVDALKRMDAAERRSEQQEFDAALGELDAIESQGLPGAALERVSALRAQIDEAHAAYREQRARELSEQLEQAAAHLVGGDVDAAEVLLAKLETTPDTAPELRERCERLRGEAAEARSVLESFAAAEDALQADDPNAAARRLDQLEAATTLPDWAVERVGQLRGRVAELEQAQRDRAVKQATAALQDAAAALEVADHAAASEHLATAQDGARLSPELEQRHEELAQAAAELETWLPKVSAVEAALEQGQLAQAYEDAVALLKQTPIPAPVEKRLRLVEEHSREKIVAHRESLTNQLQALGAELDERGRRVRSFTRRIEAIKVDALAAQEHQDLATELEQRFAALPRPRGFPVPIAIAAAVVVVVGGVGWYLVAGNSDSGGAEPPELVTSHPEPNPIPIPEDDPREQIAQALEQVRNAYAQVVAELPADQAPPDWEFYFEPEDAFATTLYARESSGQLRELASFGSADEIEISELPAAWRDQLFVVAEPVEPPDKVDGTEEPVVDVTPTEPDWPAELVAGTRSDLSEDQLTTLLGSIASPHAIANANPPLHVLAEIVEQVEIGERSAQDSLTARMVLAGGAGAVSGEFAFEQAGDRWQPAADNAGKLRGLLAGSLSGVQGRVSAVAGDIQQHYLDGKLVAAYQAYEEVQTLASTFTLSELREPVARLDAAHALLPPRWTTPDGYEESAERDEDLGYPARLTMSGRTLLLVSVPPADRLWDEIRAADQARPASRDAVGYTLAQQARQAPLERQWHLFYVEAAEPRERVESDARSAARQQAGRDLPTTEQWLLAALKLRAGSDASGFFGGLWEWCRQDAQPWVCGGCDELHSQYLPWPDEQAELSEVWAWLNNALVSQPRLRGDNLAGVRTVLGL